MRRLGVCRALTVVSLLVAGVGLPALGAAAVPAGAGVAGIPAVPAADSRLEIALTAVSPAIARPGQKVTISGTVSNRGTSTVPRATVQAVLGNEPLAMREDVERWAESSGPAQGTVVGRQLMRAGLAPGGSAAFRIDIAGAAGCAPPRMAPCLSASRSAARACAPSWDTSARRSTSPCGSPGRFP